jgi:hypothetical protein
MSVTNCVDLDFEALGQRVLFDFPLGVDLFPV